MNIPVKINNENLNMAAFAVSAAVHILIFFAAVLVIRFSQQAQSSGGGYVEVTTSMSSAPPSAEQKRESQSAVHEEPAITEKKPEEEKPAEEKTVPLLSKTSVSEVAAGSAANITFNSSNTDTSTLNNIYSESTLEVSIKYPAGWTYIDQNVKNKLDGVTFIASQSSFSPPPYVHLAVQDKYLFNEARYKYKIETSSYTAYYNDPEELAGQVEQIFYIRTETDEDYSIKFIMKGEDNFKALQPVFFGMVKTFKFGDSLF